MANPTDTLIDLSFYAGKLDMLQTDPNTRIVGSLGRMVACQQVLGNPFQEFEDRIVGGIVPRVSDIDVLGTDAATLMIAREFGDALVDDQAFRDTDVTVECEDGTWILRSQEVGYEAPLDPEVMVPVRAEVAGVEIVTVPLTTHKHLHLLRPSPDTKDELTSLTLAHLVFTDFRESGGSNRMDERLFTPFRQLKTRLDLRKPTPTPAERHSRHSSKSQL